MSLRFLVRCLHRRRWASPLLAGVLISVSGATSVWANDSSSSQIKYKTLNNNNSIGIYDAIIIGGGVVGLAISRELSVRGYRITLLEKNSDLVSEATSGSTGVGCTGYDAPPFSLERKLLRRSIQLHQKIYPSLGLSYDHIKKTGALVVAWTEEDLCNLNFVLEDNHLAGDTEATLISREVLLEREPSISKAALGAVFVPREAIAEPWLVPIAFAASAKLHGAQIELNQEVVKLTWKNDDVDSEGHWIVNTKSSGEYRGRVVINCAGLYGDAVETIGPREDPPPFHITPRKGQFILFRLPNDLDGPNSVIQMVPTQITKGLYVFTNLYGLVVVGPTSELQHSRSDRSNDEGTLALLRAHGEKVIPALKNAEIIGCYAGLRPASEFRDYQISCEGTSWITVGGIRSTGLTAATGIAEYVADLYSNLRGETCNVVPYSNVSYPPYEPIPLSERVKWNVKAPSITELARNFQERRDGKVAVFNDEYAVTHPASRMGMANFDTHRRSEPQ